MPLYFNGYRTCAFPTTDTGSVQISHFIASIRRLWLGESNPDHWPYILCHAGAIVITTDLLAGWLLPHATCRSGTSGLVSG